MRCLMFYSHANKTRDHFHKKCFANRTWPINFRPTKHSARISFPDHEEVNGIRFQRCHDKLCGVFIISFIIYNTVFSLSPQMMKRKDNS